MKVKILKKSIKEGDNYCIKSLYCSVSTADDANTLAKSAIGIGATKEQIAMLIKKSDNEYGISYAFGLNCSNFTFARVERFGVLDCEIVYNKNDKGYISAKIKVVDRKEQVFGYEPPEDEVAGWSSEAPQPVIFKEEKKKEEKLNDIPGLENNLDASPDDLPF